MNKQELQTMIDSTIVPNKKKGITAESLRLVLKEMASATPEGGGSVDFVKFRAFQYFDVETSQKGIDGLIESLEAEYGVDIRGGEFHNYLLHCLEENKKSYDYVVENAGKKDFICMLQVGEEVDLFYEDIVNPWLVENGFPPYDKIELFGAIPMAVSFGATSVGGVKITDVILVEVSDGGGMTAIVNNDGSITITWEEQEEAPASNGDIVFVCTQRVDEELTPEQKKHNIEMLNKIKNAEIKPHASLAIPQTYDFGTFTTNSIAWETTYMSDPELGDIVYMAVFIGGAFQEVIVYSDGTVEIFTE